MTALAIDLLSWTLGLFDQAFRILNLVLGPARPKFFSGGYGPEFSAVCERRTAVMIGEKQPLPLTDKDITWQKPQVSSGITSTHGSFPSPMADLLPAESKMAQFVLIEPTDQGSTPGSDAPPQSNVLVVMLPATGEMGTGARRKMARRLALERGWSSLILTAPYYGRRRPSGQRLFFLATVQDILAQSLGVSQEAALLVEYFQRRESKPLACVTGFSYGAAMAAVSCSLLRDGSRVACAAYVGSASPVCMADGILATSIDWKALAMDPNERQSVTQQRLWNEFNQTQLAPLPDAMQSRRKSEDDKDRQKVAVVKAVNMLSDAFISPRYAMEFRDQMFTELSSSTSFTWYAGGHVWAALRRPSHQFALIVKAVEELHKKQ